MGHFEDIHERGLDGPKDIQRIQLFIWIFLSKRYHSPAILINDFFGMQARIRAKCWHLLVT